MPMIFPFPQRLKMKNIFHNQRPYLLFFPLVVLLIMIGGIIQFITFVAKREQELQQAQKDMKAILSDEIVENDPWGMPYQVTEITENDKSIGKKVITFGPDKVAGTTDDMMKESVEFDLSRASEKVGRVVGNTARGFWKGLWEKDK